MVVVGKPDSIWIPELPRQREGALRLRGLRLLHTHLAPSGLSEEDLTDMLFLRLDAVVCLTVSPDGEPVQWQAGHLLPQGLQGSLGPEGSSGAPYRAGPLRPWDQTQGDLLATALSIEEELGGAEQTRDSRGLERALVVSVSAEPRRLQERNLDELEELARTAGLEVCGRMVQRVRQVNPRFILGRGKMAELEVKALMGRAETLVFDGELSPAQQRSLADITERRVLDRTQLILDIFAQHAVTKAGKLQVELARLKYALPRLSGASRSMDRLMGGIGGKGLGETKLELDRRRTRERMARLARELETLRRQRAFTRSGRDRSGIPTAALVGYTNAGKSSLLNRLTNSSVLAEDKLFATLDTTTRRLRFPEEREIVVADTVGFIRSLPRELMEAFRATLEELGEADLLIHVADASQSDLVQQTEAVLQTLAELGFDRTPRLLVLNKWDLLETEARASLGDLYPGAIHVSAKTGEGLKDLLLAIEQKLLMASYALDAQAIAPEAGTAIGDGTGDGPSEAPELDAFSALWPEGWDAPVQ